MTERGMLDLTEVVLLARREFEVGAFVESTGGGAATIYVGPRRWDKDDPSIYRYAVAAGPGWGPVNGGSASCPSSRPTPKPRKRGEHA